LDFRDPIRPYIAITVIQQNNGFLDSLVPATDLLLAKWLKRSGLELQERWAFSGNFQLRTVL
jgi:hypothetical protein